VLRAEAVRQLGKDGDLQLLQEALEDRDADVRLLAVLQLGGRERGNVETARILVHCFQDDAAAVRRAAAWQLSWCWRDPEQMRLLEAAAHDDDPQVRAAAELASTFMHDHKEYITGW
jgi:HEAT repeat protein